MQTDSTYTLNTLTRINSKPSEGVPPSVKGNNIPHFINEKRLQISSANCYRQTLTQITAHAVSVCTPPRWIVKKCYKKLFTHVESHVSAVSLLKTGE